jgi:hypothetical protein
MEGMMSYYKNDITADEMVEKLINLGFQAIINNE